MITPGAPAAARHAVAADAGAADPSPRRSGVSPWEWLALAPLLWLALGLRFFRISGQSLWSDEGITAVMAGRSVPDI
ncbi:MAG: hypothetical protein NTZ05_15170, partial [Chloroflexi bacterium]|nr:hypothetical protein [Chloroflexota bacterium]